VSIEDTHHDIIKEIQISEFKGKECLFSLIPGDALSIIEEYLTEDIDSTKLPEFSLTCKIVFSNFVGYKIENYKI